jgi:hypothetical protein
VNNRRETPVPDPPHPVSVSDMRFPEREVDAVLRAWCAGGEVDHVTLRRYLLDEGLLSRDHGTYWRIGGWVDVLGASA